MATPKYLPIAKKVPYNIRLPKKLLDSLNDYAELTDKTTTDVVITALNQFMRDKTINNTYLENIKGITIEIPMLFDEKNNMKNRNLINGVSYSVVDKDAGELYNIDATSTPYEIMKVPNNLDTFNKDIGYYSTIASGSSGNLIGHKGIEIAILPDTINYDDNAYEEYSFIESLYCFYFEFYNDRIGEINIIDYISAVNLFDSAGNNNMKNNLISCVNELKILDKQIKKLCDNNVDDDIILDSKKRWLCEMADKYNTGNITPLGDNIEDKIKIDEFNDNPEYLDLFYNDLKADNESYVDKVINEKLGNIDEKIADIVADIVDFRLTNIEKLVRNDIKKKEIIQSNHIKK